MFPLSVRPQPASRFLRSFPALCCFIILSVQLTGQTVFYSKATGNLNSTSTWGSNTDGSGTQPTNFNTAGRLYIVTNTQLATIAGNWNVGGTGSKIQVGNGISSTELSIPSNFGITGTVDVMNNGTLTIQDNANPTLGTLSAGSTVNYARGANQNVANANYYNLILSTSGVKSLQNNFSTSITNSLIINTNVSFRLHTNNTLTATISGSVSGGGVMIGSNNSILNVTGSGDFGTLNLSSNTNLYGLYLNRINGTVHLGSDLTVANFFHTNGALELNSNLLTLDGAVSFPSQITNGYFIGSTSSSVSIAASTSTISGKMVMDQTNAASRSINRLSFSRLADTLKLANDLNIQSSFVHTNGFLDLGGQALSVNGIITFPNNITNGYFIGSATSSLIIGGTGAVNNNLFMDPTSSLNKTLGLLRIDHTGGTIILGNDIICGSLFDHINGTFSLGGNHLFLNGNISFPVSISNGALTGSGSSSLSIGGSGSFTNALLMTQSNATTRTLDYLNLNRSAQRLSLGNPLIVDELAFSNGEFNINGTSLTLNGSISFPAAITNGYFVGSPSSSLTIATSLLLINNPLILSQANANERSLSSFSFNRTAQTLVLGNNLTVLNAYTQTNGFVSIGSTSLTIGGSITFPSGITNGYFIGSATSSLTINGTSISNSLKMDQSSLLSRNLNAFTINSSNASLVLGSALICDGNYVHNNGAITLGANILTLNGAVTFPLSATNGSYTGSNTSSLNIGGTGAITNPCWMSQASTAARTLNNFALNRLGSTFSIGNPLICNVYTQSNGNVNLNGSLLTLGSTITFPALSTNGVMIGSLSSSLIISGSGAITNPLRFEQANTSSKSLYDITFARAGQSLTLGDQLEIRNSVLVSNGTFASAGFLKLKADATRSAMVGNMGGSLTGNVTVETYAPGGFTGWTNLGPSGVTGLTVANWENQMPMTCFGCPYNEYSAGGYFVSIQGYNETLSGNAAYVPLSYTSALTRGVGYWAYVGTGQATTSAITYSVSGPVVSGNVVMPLTVSANSGNNLVSNPYAAPIDWDLVAADAANINVSGSVYFYNPDLGQTISYAGGISNPSGYIANGVIPMGQGFYVVANSAGNITFRESHKSASNTNVNPLLRLQPMDPGNVMRLSISGNEGDYDETTFRFHDSATIKLDRLLDAKKIFQTPGYVGTSATYSTYTTISSRIETDDYSINSLPFTNNSYNIPILAKARVSGKYKIASLGLENFEQNSCFALYDKWLNKEHLLKNGEYEFELSDTVTLPRFELRICKDLLPAALTAEDVGSNQLDIYSTPDSEIHVKKNVAFKGKTTVSLFTLLGVKIKSDLVIDELDDSMTIPMNDYRQQLVLVKTRHESGEATKIILIQ